MKHDEKIMARAKALARGDTAATARLYTILSRINPDDKVAAPVLKALERVQVLRTEIAATRTRIEQLGEHTPRGITRQMQAALRLAKDELASLTRAIAQTATALQQQREATTLPAGDATAEAQALSEFRSLNLNQRNEALANAVAGRDVDLALALARARPGTSGIAPATRDMLVRGFSQAPADSTPPNPALAELVHVTATEIQSFEREITAETVEA